MQQQTVLFTDLAHMAYQKAWELQEKLLQANVGIKTSNKLRTAVSGSAVLTVPPDDTSHHLLFVEHEPVYTLGKSGHMENLLLTASQLEEKNIHFYNTNRGGDITFHGPGQLVGYPILDLEKFGTDIAKYLRRMEEVIILTLSGFGIRSARSAGETGVWIDPQIPGSARKICAMGVRCSRWITMHGFALNVNTDLGYFDYIIPCGIKNKRVTSLQHELGEKLPVDLVKESLRKNFEKVFDCSLIEYPMHFIL